MPCLRYLIFFFFKQQQQKPSKIIISFRKPSIVLGFNLTFCLCCTVPVLNLHTDYDCLFTCLFTTHSAHPFSQYLSVTDTYTNSQHRYDPFEESDWQIVSEEYILCWINEERNLHQIEKMTNWALLVKALWKQEYAINGHLHSLSVHCLALTICKYADSC